MLEILGLIGFTLVLLVGLVMVPLGLPGTFLIVADAAIYGLFTGWKGVSLALVLGLLGIAITGEVLEQLIGIRGAIRYGGSRAGMWGAFIGGLLGAFSSGLPLPIIGNLIGAFCGAFLGALLVEWLLHGDLRRAIRSAYGALIGRAKAAMVKFILAIAMVAILLVKVLW